jgi:hypothetical protein
VRDEQLRHSKRTVMPPRIPGFEINLDAMESR